MKDHINRRIKFREGFRPFAPVILEAEASCWFDDYCDSPNMSFAFPVKAGLRGKVPAITHVDGRARLQTVRRSPNGRLYSLLRHFQGLTGIPMLLNTSFNLQGQPIVCSPRDAVECFAKTDMDYLLLGDCLVERSVLPPVRHAANKGNDARFE